MYYFAYVIYIHIMPDFMRNYIYLFLLFFVFSACQKDKNAYLYELNETEVSSVTGKKTKRKTEEQYVSILYANLFQQALSSADLFEITKCIMSIGDKEVAHKVVVSNLMNRPDVKLPSNTEIRADLTAFIFDTYKRFYVREPSIAEKTWWLNYLNANPQITSEIVYVSFALSEEYLYY